MSDALFASLSDVGTGRIAQKAQAGAQLPEPRAAWQAGRNTGDVIDVDRLHSEPRALASKRLLHSSCVPTRCSSRG
jgi:hypothetical protein